MDAKIAAKSSGRRAAFVEAKGTRPMTVGELPGKANEERGDAR